MAPERWVTTKLSCLPASAHVRLTPFSTGEPLLLESGPSGAGDPAETGDVELTNGAPRHRP
ncbi:hypothetical protein Micbo1qcDRAFT_164180, partial [Microdochium bolleyi]